MRVKIHLEGDAPTTRELHFADHLNEEEAITNALMALAPHEYECWSTIYLYRKGLCVPRVILNRKSLVKPHREASTAEDMELGDQGQSGG